MYSAIKWPHRRQNITRVIFGVEYSRVLEYSLQAYWKTIDAVEFDCRPTFYWESRIFWSRLVRLNNRTIGVTVEVQLTWNALHQDTVSASTVNGLKSQFLFALFAGLWGRFQQSERPDLWVITTELQLRHVHVQLGHERRLISRPRLIVSCRCVRVFQALPAHRTQLFRPIERLAVTASARSHYALNRASARGYARVRA